MANTYVQRSTAPMRTLQNLAKATAWAVGDANSHPCMVLVPLAALPISVSTRVSLEVDERSDENLAGSEGGRMPHGPGPRSHSVNNFDDARGPPGANLHNFYASQRHQSSRGSNEAEQVMQAKRRMAAQRERELRNLHTEQQYQRSRPPSAV